MAINKIDRVKELSEMSRNFDKEYLKKLGIQVGNDKILKAFEDFMLRGGKMSKLIMISSRRGMMITLKKNEIVKKLKFEYDDLKSINRVRNEALQSFSFPKDRSKKYKDNLNDVFPLKPIKYYGNNANALREFKKAIKTILQDSDILVQDKDVDHFLKKTLDFLM